MSSYFQPHTHSLEKHVRSAAIYRQSLQCQALQQLAIAQGEPPLLLANPMSVHRTLPLGLQLQVTLMPPLPLAPPLRRPKLTTSAQPHEQKRDDGLQSSFQPSLCRSLHERLRGSHHFAQVRGLRGGGPRLRGLQLLSVRVLLLTHHQPQPPRHRHTPTPLVRTPPNPRGGSGEGQQRGGRGRE